MRTPNDRINAFIQATAQRIAKQYPEHVARDARDAFKQEARRDAEREARWMWSRRTIRHKEEIPALAEAILRLALYEYDRARQIHVQCDVLRTDTLARILHVGAQERERDAQGIREFRARKSRIHQRKKRRIVLSTSR